jgi:hypothetical protein
VRRRRKPARAAEHHGAMRFDLQFPRHVRPDAREAGLDITDARLVTLAKTAPAGAPERQRFAIEAADRGGDILFCRGATIDRFLLLWTASARPHSRASTRGKRYSSP